MSGRVAIDFGNANTVVALFDGETNQARAAKIEPYSRMQIWGDEEIPLIPSLIHYREDGSFLVGNEVLAANLARHEHTFIALKSAVDTVHAIKVGKVKISARQAAEDFLTSVAQAAIKQLAIKKDEAVAVTVPVDAFEQYSKWLADVFQKVGLGLLRFIDEPAAAALSFGKTIKQNDDYLVFDFGAGSLDVAVVRFHLDPGRAGNCKVLGKRSMQLGGNNIDQWLVQHFLQEQGIDPARERGGNLTWILNAECRAAKEKLSFSDAADIAVTDYKTGKALSRQLTREDLVAVLEEHDFFAKVDRTINGAEMVAQYDHGYKRKKLAGAFMVGGTSIIPELQKQLRRTFGKERVEVFRPLDSIAAGAAAFAAGASLYDHIQHDYAIEVLNLKAQKTQMKVIVQSGEKYPSEMPVATEVIKAATYGQTKFQIYIYEISKEEIEAETEGMIDLAQVTRTDPGLRYVCLNKAHPTLLETKRPIMYDHPAMEIAFRIDENKHLVIDTFRFETDELKVPDLQNVSVVRLT
jgi:molecular chaperone DnaK